MTSGTCILLETVPINDEGSNCHYGPVELLGQNQVPIQNPSGSALRYWSTENTDQHQEMSWQRVASSFSSHTVYHTTSNQNWRYIRPGQTLVRVRSGPVPLLAIHFFWLLPEKFMSKHRCMTEPANGLVHLLLPHSLFFSSIRETTMS